MIELDRTNEVQFIVHYVHFGWEDLFLLYQNSLKPPKFINLTNLERKTDFAVQTSFIRIVLGNAMLC